MRVGLRGAALALLLGAAVQGAPSLTAIEDVLYKADGTLINGVVIIEWNSFQASDSSNIAKNRLTSAIVRGVLRLRLVPTTNALEPASYSVHYYSDGRVQYDETWAVPPSTATLRLKDVRVAAGSGGGQPANSTQIQESDVVGLVDDLAARPLKGPGYEGGRTAYINDLGGIEAISGSPADCVRVDGTAGPCDPSPGPVFVDAETPAGQVDGSNAVFSLTSIPAPPSSLALYRNGLLQKAGLDYTLSGNSITFVAAPPQTGDVLVAFYRL